jgi:hypothetical protein
MVWSIKAGSHTTSPGFRDSYPDFEGIISLWRRPLEGEGKAKVELKMCKWRRGVGGARREWAGSKRVAPGGVPRFQSREDGKVQDTTAKVQHQILGRDG